MPATVDYYAEVVAAFPDTESLTVLTVAGATRDQVAAQLGVDLLEPVEEDAWADGDQSAWALLEVPGGVVAVELSGFGDPSNDDLASLSMHGSAAVVRSNILAHYRFGCARGGELVYDDDEYIFARDPEAIPGELNALFVRVYDDLTDDPDDARDGSAPFVVALAMAEVVTGLDVTAAHVSAVLASGFFAGPSARYPGPGDSTTDDAESEEESLRSPCLLTATEGAYVIGASPYPGTFSDPPAVWPRDIFCVAVHPGAAWVRKLSPQPETKVLLTTVYAETEPTEVLQRASGAHDHQSSVVLISEMASPGGVWTTGNSALRVYDCCPFEVQTFLIDQPGTYQLRVFATTANNAQDHEDHLLVIWPDPDAQPDIRHE